MPLITFIKPRSMIDSTQRMTMEEMLLAQLYPNLRENAKYSKNFFRVRTIHRALDNLITIDDRLMDGMGTLLRSEYTKEYIHFRIPKASGGTRHIEAPAPALKLLQRNITSSLLNDFRILPHDAAYAYTRGRCAYDALVTHQRHNARWFLKLDIKDFFPSITADLLMKVLPEVYPITWFTNSMLTNLVNIATNEQGVLPQGSPLSPLLSNLIMVEFDLRLTSALQNYFKGKCAYTRYADDILISSPFDFQFTVIVNIVERIFNELGLPFTLNRPKIRYASMAGSNWNLGLMYNKDQNITVGNKRKRILHSLLNTFVIDCNQGTLWTVQETQELVGKLGYLKNVEPTYYDTLIRKYETKFGCDIRELFKRALNQPRT